MGSREVDSPEPDTTGGVLPEQPPLRLRCAARALGRSVLLAARLLGQRRIAHPEEHLGDVLEFADGPRGRVYRETVVRPVACADPAVLVVEFRLRWVRGRGHALFRAESVLNTPLFVGFPGFVSKLWLAHDAHGVYRGFYQWDGAGRAAAYARALWWVLALVSVPGSVHYVVLPERDRDEVLRDPASLDGVALAGTYDWWRLTKVERGASSEQRAGGRAGRRSGADRADARRAGRRPRGQRASPRAQM
jgi:hypothetical protein